MPTKHEIVEELLAHHGQTFSEELGIKLEDGTPSPLFQWLCASVLYSARIDSQIATRSTKELQKAGWRTAQAMAGSSWDARTRALTEGGYTRYRERTATMLGDLSEHVIERWDGDLRNLREEAGQDAQKERALLKEVKGLGEVGVDIFMRETQGVWSELAPFADKRALKTAQRLKLGDDAQALRGLVQSDQELVRLVAALVRATLEDDVEEISESAS